MPPFINLISQGNVQLGTTIAYIQKELKLYDEPAIDAPVEEGTYEQVDMNVLNFQENVPDTISIATRGGLYIYLNAIVSPSQRWPYHVNEYGSLQDDR